MLSNRQPTQIETELMGGDVSERDRVRGERMVTEAGKKSESRGLTRKLRKVGKDEKR